MKWPEIVPKLACSGSSDSGKRSSLETRNRLKTQKDKQIRSKGKRFSLQRTENNILNFAMRIAYFLPHLNPYISWLYNAMSWLRLKQRSIVLDLGLHVQARGFSQVT